MPRVDAAAGRFDQELDRSGQGISLMSTAAILVARIDLFGRGGQPSPCPRRRCLLRGKA